MAIKLKNMIHKNGTNASALAKKINPGLTLYLVISIASAIYCANLMHAYADYWVPIDYVRKYGLAYLSAGVIWFSITAGYIIYISRNCRGKMKRWKLDNFSVEIVAGAGLMAGILWTRGVCGIVDSCMLFYTIWVAAWKEIITVTVFLFFPLILCCYGSVVLLIRKLLLKEFKEASVICRMVEGYRAEIPFAGRMRQVNMAAFLIMTICLAAIVIGGAPGLWVKASKVWMWILVVAAVVMYLVFIGRFVKNRVYEDMDRLLVQIDAMAKGKLNAPGIANEESDLYQASQKLHAISGNLQSMVEKQTQAERMKVDLITNVSHDLKTPLTSMGGYIDLLKNEELSAEAKDYVGVLSMKQEQLKKMIQDIFDLSKATSGNIQLEMEELDMKKLIEQTLADMEDVIRGSGMIIRTKIADGELRFCGDGKKLYRVLQNVVHNALKYSLKGTRIYIEAGERGGRVYTTVKNTAAYEMDFTPEEIKERFTRGDKSRNTDGHGLGLAIADSFTTNMGGEFGVAIDGDQFKVCIKFDSLMAQDVIIK